MTRVLLTGVTGFLGSHVARKFLRNGIEVIGLKRPSSSIDRLRDISREIFFVDYIGNAEGLTPSFLGAVDVVIHAATRYDSKDALASELVEANINLPVHVLEASTRCGADTFINIDTFFSSAENYEYLPRYSLSKRHFSEWGKLLWGGEKSRFLNVRLEHLYGPGDSMTKFVPKILDSLLANQPEIELTMGEQIRDFIFIDDATQALLSLVLRRNEFADGFSQIGLGSGIGTSIREFVGIAHRISNSKTKLSFGALPYRPGEIMLSYADISSLSALGWMPKFLPESGLKICVEHAVGRNA